LDKIDVSIIIPVYNVQDYLPECLDSVIEQTISSREIIIINDGSTDKSYEILKEYKKRFPELIIINQENSGISETRNVGLRLAKGEYVGFVDSDDFIKLTMYEKMYEVASRDNCDIVICNYILYDEMQSTKAVKEFDEDGNIDKIEVLKKFLLNDVKAYAWNKLYKRELFTDNKIVFPSFVVCEDTPAGFLLFAQAKKISVIEEPLYYYRQRQKSLTNTYSLKAMEDMISGCYIMRDYITKNPLLCEKLSDYYRVYMIKTLWAINNKYWIQFCETGQKNSYHDFKQLVAQEIKALKIHEIVVNDKLKLKYKVNALLIKTKTYGPIFSVIYKLKSVKK